MVSKLRKEVRYYQRKATLAAIQYPGPNKCADVTANMGRTGFNLPQDMPLLLAAAGQVPSMPDPPPNLSLEDALFWARVQEARDPIIRRQVANYKTILHDIDFSCATANVLSLKARSGETIEDGAAAAASVQLTSARRLDLAAQCENAKLHVIGLQETRPRAPKGWDLLSYHTFAAPATA